MKKIIAVLVIIASIALIYWKLKINQANNQEKIDVVAEKNAAVSVKVATVETKIMSTDFVANGNFQPIQELIQNAEFSGKIIKVLVDEGSVVSAGQTIAIMRGDRIDVDAQNAEAVLATAQTDYNRYENAFKSGGVTKQQLDQAKMMLTNAEARVKQSKLNVADTRVKAAISGIINRRLIEPGSIMTAMPPTPMFEIVNVSRLKLKVNANEAQVAGLKVGSTIKVNSSVFPDKDFSGKIIFIAPKADASLNFPVEIEVANAGNSIKAGMYGTADFQTGQKQAMKIVPRNAFVGSVSDNQIFVNDKGVAVLKKVVSGRVIGNEVEIIDGLNEGDQVIITGQLNLVNGSKVEVLK